MHADGARADTRHAPLSLTSLPRAVCLSSIGRGPGYAVDEALRIAGEPETSTGSTFFARYILK